MGCPSVAWALARAPRGCLPALKYASLKLPGKNWATIIKQKNPKTTNHQNHQTTTKKKISMKNQSFCRDAARWVALSCFIDQQDFLMTLLVSAWWLQGGICSECYLATHKPPAAEFSCMAPVGTKAVGAVDQPKSEKGVLRGRARHYFHKYKCFFHLIPLQGLTLKGLVINLSLCVF